MSDVDYARVTELFQAAIELPPHERTAFLDRACGADTALRAELESMLRHDADTDGALDDDEAGVGIEIIRHARVHDVGSEPPTPETIGRYRVIRKLGEGGMGTVFEAEEDHPQRSVALKLLRSGLATHTVMQRFRREIDLLGRLQHPGIAQIYEAGTAAIGATEQPYFAMELVRGLTITEFAVRHALDTRTRLDLVARLCDAVQHAHQHGIIHRDLKPANILVDESIEGGQPKVLDFGVARALGADVHTATLRTEVGQLIGTLRYMSPEQVLGDSTSVDTRSDVYALGVVLYELLTGTMPYDIDDRSIPEAVRVIRDDEPRRLSFHGKHLRGDTETILGKALEKEVDRRYQSARELATDIRHYLDDEPIMAHRTTAVYQLRRFARRNRTLVGGVVATVLALIAGIIGTTKYALDSKKSAILATKERDAARWQGYRSTIGAAAMAVDLNDIPGAERLLDEAPVELRGWEWRYLRKQLQQWDTTLEAPSPLVGDICIDTERGEVLAAMETGGVGVWRTDGWQWTGAQATELELATMTRRAVGGLVALGTRTGDVILWDRATGEMRTISVDDREPATGRNESVQMLQFDGDGSSLLVMRQKEAQVVRIPSGELVDRVADPSFDHGICGATVDRTSGLIALVQNHKTFLWHPGAGKPRPSETILDNPAAVAFAPNGSVVAVGTLFRNIHLIDAQTGSILRMLSGHSGGLEALEFSADGAYLASTSDDRTIVVWDVGLGIVVNTFFDGGTPEAVRFVGDDHTLLLSRSTGSAHVRLWSLDHGTSRALGELPSYAYAVACSADGSMVAAVEYTGSREADEAVWVWRVDEPMPTLTHELTGNPNSIAFSPDSTLLLSSSSLWNLQNHTMEKVTIAQTYARMGTAGFRRVKTDRFSPDGSIRATISRENRVLQLWAGTTKEILATLIELGSAPEERVYGCAFSPDGRSFAAALEDGSIRIWDLETMTSNTDLRGHTVRAYCVEYSPDGTRLASGSNDNTIRIWSVERGESLLELRGHTSYVHDIVFSPDGTRLFSASGDKTVRMWETAHEEGPPSR